MSSEPHVVLTRPDGDNERLAGRLAQAGIASRAIPCVRIVALTDRGPLRAAVRELTRHDVLVVTSRAGARAVGDALGEERCLAPVAAVGGATADACRAAGLNVFFTPSVATGAALAEELPLPRGSVRLARSDRAAGIVGEILRRRGATVREVVAYRTEPVAPDGVSGIADADAIVFASPSAVDGFAASGARPSAIVVAIGPTTAVRVRRQLGIEPVTAGPDDDAIATLLASTLGGRHATATR